MNQQKRVLSIGAHPDDADTSCAILLKKLADQGWEVRLLSVTDGSRGTMHLDLVGEKLSAIRRREAARSGEVFGGRYDVMEYTDSRLQADPDTREQLIRYIRHFAPDLIISHRPSDTHPDHRNTALLVQDASYLLTVPSVCPDAPVMKHEPVILYWHDSFQTPYPFRADVVVPAGEAETDTLVRCASCHESQYFDWMYWPDNLHKRDWPREKQIADLRERFSRGLARTAKTYAKEISARFPGREQEITRVEVFEICEHGSAPSPELISALQR